MTRTVTLQEQMQVIMEKMPEPAVIDGECKVLMTPREARARLDEMYADPHAFTTEEYAEITALVAVLQDAREALIDGRAGSDEHATGRGPLTALMSEDQREQEPRY